MAEFLWFIGGALVYKVLSKLLRVGHTAHLIKELQLNVIKFLASAVQDVAFIHALKYKLMNEAKISEEKILNEKKIDDEDFSLWKKDVIKRLHSSVSPLIASNLSFKNWQDLVNILDEYYKTNKKNER